MSDETTPVLVGGGQFTWRGDPGASPSPTALLKIAAERAAQDAGLGSEALAGVDGLAVISFAVDAPGGERLTEVLRERLGLRGTKVGCDAGDCPAGAAGRGRPRQYR